MDHLLLHQGDRLKLTNKENSRVLEVFSFAVFIIKKKPEKKKVLYLLKKFMSIKSVSSSVFPLRVLCVFFFVILSNEVGRRRTIYEYEVGFFSIVNRIVKKKKVLLSTKHTTFKESCLNIFYFSFFFRYVDDVSAKLYLTLFAHKFCFFF
jgi:hypothetical protein